MGELLWDSACQAKLPTAVCVPSRVVREQVYRRPISTTIDHLKYHWWYLKHHPGRTAAIESIIELQI